MPETVVIASPDGRLTAYDPYTGTVLARFTGTKSPRNGITIIGNNQFASSHISTETVTGAVHLYYWWSPSCRQSIYLPEPVGPLAATGDGMFLFSGSVSGQIHSSSVLSGEVIRSVSAHENSVSCVSISSDDSLILSGSDDGTITVISIFILLDPTIDSIDTNSMLFGFKRFTGHKLPVTGITTGSSIMVSSSLDWTCKIWDLINGIHLQTVRFAGEIICAVFDPLETEIYVSVINGFVYKKKVKVETRNEVMKGGETVVYGGRNGGGVVAMEMLDYGKSLLTVSDYGEICVWEVEDGKMISSFNINGGGVSGVMVVKGGGWFGKIGIESEEFVGGYGGGEAVGTAVKEAAEMEEVMKVAVDDRSRAISEFESAIQINEKLMQLMLNEAKAIAKFNDY